jgi:hypothetical protein
MGASTAATKPVDVSPIRDLFMGHVDHIVKRKPKAKRMTALAT